MRDQLPLIYELHKTDFEYANIKKTINSLDNGSTLKVELAAAKKNLENVQEQLRKIRTEINDAELSLKSIENKKKTLEKRMYNGEISSPKELLSMEKEIEALAKSKDSLEDKILLYMGYIEEGEIALNKNEIRVKNLEKKFTAVVDEYNSRVAAFSNRLEELNNIRKEVTAAIEPGTLAKYENIRTKKGDVGVGIVDDSCCSACHMTLTSYTLRQVREMDNFVYCESCGRIILYPLEKDVW